MIVYLKHIDEQLFLALNGYHNEWMDTLMFWASNKYTWIPLYLFSFILIIKKHKFKTIAVVVTIFLLIAVADQLSVLLFKEIFQRLRPCHEPSLEGLVHLVKNKCGGQYGFISSHATNSFALAVFIIGLIGQQSKILVGLMVFYALINCYSRVYLGVHYPGDVLAGAIFGSLVGYLFLKTYLYLDKKYLKNQ